MWKHKNFINLQLCAGPIPYEVIVNGTTFYIQRLSDSGATGEETWSYNASINTDNYTISGNTVVWNDGTILQYNGVDVLPTDDIIGIVGNPGIYTTRASTPQPTLTFKHFFDAGTIGTGTVKFRHYSQQAQLATPQNVAASGTTVSWGAVENATSYEILVSGSSFGTVSTTSVDLSTLSGWASLTDGTYNITIIAKADGYRDSEPSAAVSVTKAPAVVMPNKGDIITLDSKQYRVLKVNGSVAEVLCMYDANSSINFDSASSGYNNTYVGKDIDTYCNNTFYNDLSAAMKSAIVDKTFTQDKWSRDSDVPTASHYTGKYGSSTYYLTLANAAFGTSITRHCYCLSIQDVLDYLEATTSMGMSDTTLTDTNVWKMFWNVTTSVGSKFIWLRSAYSSKSSNAFSVYGGSGSLNYYRANSTFVARPAFQIDLSKISWSK